MDSFLCALFTCGGALRSPCRTTQAACVRSWHCCASSRTVRLLRPWSPCADVRGQRQMLYGILRSSAALNRAPATNPSLPRRRALQRRRCEFRHLRGQFLTGGTCALRRRFPSLPKRRKIPRFSRHYARYDKQRDSYSYGTSKTRWNAHLRSDASTLSARETRVCEVLSTSALHTLTQRRAGTSPPRAMGVGCTCMLGRASA